jgi:uncharacterized protein (DUF58 family)
VARRASVTPGRADLQRGPSDDDSEDAPSRPVTGLTRRGWTLAGASAGLVVGSRVLGAGPLAGLGIAGGLLLLFAALWVSLRRPRVSVQRHVRPTRLHAGGEGRVLLEIEATTTTPLLTLSDAVDGGRRAARFVVPPQAPGSTLQAAYRVPTARRGLHVVGPLLATVSDPLGLARRSQVVAESGDIIVCPRIHEVAPPRRGGGGEPAAHAEGARSPAVEPLGEFLSLRDYEAGDDPRRVNWKASARVGDLLVRQDEAASPGRVVLVLDTRTSVHDEDSFEVAVEAIASIAVRLRRERAPVEVVTTGGEILGRPGPGSLELLLDRLAVVELSHDDHLGAVVASLRNRLGVGTIVVATGAVDRSVVEAASLLRARMLVTIIQTFAAAPGAAVPAAGKRIPIIDAVRTPFAEAWNAAARTRRGAAALAGQRRTRTAAR